MAIKKSELYSSLWASCDELRGGMDPSQYKDYVLMMLFVKYVSDKYAGQMYAPITIPQGASFADMVALKGKPTIGDDINKKIIGPLANANKLTGVPDFNDSEKLGDAKAKVDTLTNLISIFESKDLDFSQNRAEGDDILGDAYEYLMRHFASESGKSKGQFYTPAEVSRILAKIIGIDKAQTSGNTTVYDPTCGSGSLLLKVTDEASTPVGLYGQEKDSATSGLARMNMILHNNPTAVIKQGNTLANPLFLNEHDTLETFDFIVANPPFSDKRWGNGVDAVNDEHGRFQHYGIPPHKNGDYAYLLHIIRSLKSKGKGACILPHGVLFRGNAEADIREALIGRGYIKGIIGLPDNLFYGTNIPACIIMIDKEGAAGRKGIFMVDASKGFIKDGNKNRLREMDIHKIVDVFNKQTAIEGYSLMVSYDEIKKNEYDLSIPRNSAAEDLQDIEAHLLGDIPKLDIDAMDNYWQIFPKLKSKLFNPAKRSADYYSLQVGTESLKQTIFEHSEFVDYIQTMNKVFNGWKATTQTHLKALKDGFHPKEEIHTISEALLTAYTDKPLLDKYDVYQHLMNYWAAVMQDDCYLIAADGWKAETYRIIVTNKNKKEVDKGWTCDLVPKTLVINRYFVKEQQAIDELIAQSEQYESQRDELKEEHSGEEGALKDVSSKADATTELQENIELAWDMLDTSSFQRYFSLQQQLEKALGNLIELKNDSFLEALKNGKGNITIKAVKERLKQSDDQEEINILNDYQATDTQYQRLAQRVSNATGGSSGTD